MWKPQPCSREVISIDFPSARRQRVSLSLVQKLSQIIDGCLKHTTSRIDAYIRQTLNPSLDHRVDFRSGRGIEWIQLDKI